MGRRPTYTYPFSAIVGQQMLKTALLLNAVDPLVGGVLIRGEKGTAKSTAVRALAALLPEHDVVEGCRFQCDPADPGTWCEECRDRHAEGGVSTSTVRPGVVELPVSATEDRLVGTLDLEHALKCGERVFDPGLLAEANRSILYVDEVNLLDDHLVDTLLDAAAMGVNTVQREGVSFVHPARFILVGTMNPEEGDVRPQLLDRFGLCVDITAERDPADRVEIVKRCRAFDNDANQFTRAWVDAEDEIQVRLKHARLRLPTVDLAETVLESIALLCARTGVDGHRADLTMARAACALSALEGRTSVTDNDVLRIAPLVLAHRVRHLTSEDREASARTLDEILARPVDPSEIRNDIGSDPTDPPPDGMTALESAIASFGEMGSSATIDGLTQAPMDRIRRSISGRRQESVSSDRRGRSSRSEPPRAGTSTDIALDATIREAATHQATREGDMAVEVRPSDVRNKMRTRKVGSSIVICVDSSGSMGARARMDAARAAVLELLVDAYRRRDRVGLVSFRGNQAEVVLAPTSSVELARIKLESLPTGGTTPLAHGLLRSIELLMAEIRRDDTVIPWLVLVTDGRANVGLDGGLGSEDARALAARVRAERINAIVLDTGGGPRTVAIARDLALAAGADYVRLDTVEGTSLAKTVRDRVSSST